MKPWPPDRSTMQGLVFGGTLLFQLVDLGKRSKIHPGYTPRPATDGGSWRSVWPTSPGKLFNEWVPGLGWQSHRAAAPGPDGFVFVGVKGGPLRRGNFNKMSGWPDAVRTIGTAGLHFHDLRHTGNQFAEAARH